MKQQIRLINTIGLVLLFVTACGGDSDHTSDPAPLPYDGNQQAAVITTENATQFIDNFLTVSHVTTSIDALKPGTSGTFLSHSLIQPLSQLNRLLSDTQSHGAGRPQDLSQATLRTINEIEVCADNGSMHYRGELNQNGTGSLTVDMDNCTDGGVTMEGQITIQIHATDPASLTPMDYTMTFSQLNLKGPGYSFTSRANIRKEWSVENTGTSFLIIQNLSVDMVARNNLDNSMIKIQDLTITNESDFFATDYNLSISGRYYDSSHGYIDVTTREQLAYSGADNTYPDQGGQLLMTGAGNSRVMLISASAQKARLEFDRDGDSLFDDHHVYYWDNLGGEEASNEPPELDHRVIQPLVAYTADTLALNLSAAKDPDGDPLDFSITWFRNGVTQTGLTQPEYPSNRHQKGDEISVEITLSDSVHAITKTRSITILNTPPEINAGVDQSLIFGDELLLEATAVDADGDPLSYSWSIDKQPYVSKTLLSESLSTTSSVSYTKQGRYIFDFVVSDGESSSHDSIEIDISPMALFEPYQYIDLPNRLESVSIGDINSDGLNDVVLGGWKHSEQASVNAIFVLLQDGSGNLKPPVSYSSAIEQSSYNIHSTAIADINNDGRQDLVVSHPEGLGVLLQNAQGELAPIQIYDLNLNVISHYNFVVNDFNNDGLVDIAALGGWPSSGVDLFSQNNEATLNLAQSYAVTSHFSDDMDVGDVNGDGLDDIVISSGQVSAEEHFNILLQQPDHTFGTARTYNAGVYERSNAIAVGDVNNDGRDDVVLAYGRGQPTSALGIFYQDSAGELQGPVSIPSYDSPHAIEIADINGDSLTDIIVSHWARNGVGLYLQKPDGTLMAEQRYPYTNPASYPNQLAVGDINADGKQDIVEIEGKGINILYQ